MKRIESFGQPPPRTQKPDTTPTQATSWPLPDIEQRREIQIPQHVHQEMMAAITQSNAVCKEQGLVYDRQMNRRYKGEGPTVKLNVRSWQQGSVRYTSMEASGNVMTQIPMAAAGIVYHTHPEFSLQTLQQQGWTERSFQQKTGGLTLASYIATWNTQISSFSHIDLTGFFQHDQATSSMMLGTSHGLTCITCPEKNRQRKDSQSINAYAADLQKLQQNLASGQIQQNQYQPYSDQLLSTFCRKNGYIAFTNTHPTSPLLYRLT